MKNYIIVSYYTPNYEKVANTYLIPSVKKFNLPNDIVPIDSLGGWNANTSYKATFMKEMINKYPEKDVIFLDSDARIMKDPILFEQIPSQYDIAVHYLDWYLQWRGTRGQNKWEMLSGTMLFRKSSKLLQYVDKWIMNCAKSDSQWEQRVLQEIVDKSNLNVFRLPASYCAVIDFKRNIPQYVGDPIIVHHQASRHRKNDKPKKT